jgi:hypothetical protein
LALAVIAMLALMLWHQRRQPVFLVLSALALSLSVMTKLFTVFLAPVFLAGLFLAEAVHRDRIKPGWDWLKPVFTWLLVFGGITLLIDIFWVGLANTWQLILPHLGAAQTADAPTNEQLHSINFYQFLFA